MTKIQQLIDNVRAWGVQKGITGPDGKATLLSQLGKTQEELTETRDAAVALSIVVKKRQHYRAELADGIGDCAVTLILAAELAGLRFEDCLQAAYDEIKGRTGRMEGGVFVKDKPAIPQPKPCDDSAQQDEVPYNGGRARGTTWRLKK